MAKTSSRTVIKLSRPASAPKARQFLAHYFALERPNVSHLLFSKGAIDFLLGIVIGILIGLIIAIMTAGTAVAA